VTPATAIGISYSRGMSRLAVIRLWYAMTAAAVLAAVAGTVSGIVTQHRNLQNFWPGWPTRR